MVVSMLGSLSIAVVAVGGSDPSASSAGRWPEALLVVAALVIGFVVRSAIVERIAIRAELNAWLRT